MGKLIAGESRRITKSKRSGGLNPMSSINVNLSFTIPAADVDAIKNTSGA